MTAPPPPPDDAEAAAKAKADAEAAANRGRRRAPEGEGDQPAGPQPGDVVQFRHRDVITGDQLTGRGVIVRQADGLVTVQPLQPLQLQVDADEVSAVELED